jgi:hypothetical protein
MRFLSADRSVDLIISTPARAFTLSLGGHVWLFNARLEISGCLAPSAGHVSALTPDSCPGCVDFTIRDFIGEKESS